LTQLPLQQFALVEQTLPSATHTAAQRPVTQSLLQQAALFAQHPPVAVQLPAQ